MHLNGEIPEPRKVQTIAQAVAAMREMFGKYRIIAFDVVEQEWTPLESVWRVRIAFTNGKSFVFNIDNLEQTREVVALLFVDMKGT